MQANFVSATSAVEYSVASAALLQDAPDNTWEQLTAALHMEAGLTAAVKAASGSVWDIIKSRVVNTSQAEVIDFLQQVAAETKGAHSVRSLEPEAAKLYSNSMKYANILQRAEDNGVNVGDIEGGRTAAEKAIKEAKGDCQTVSDDSANPADGKLSEEDSLLVALAVIRGKVADGTLSEAIMVSLRETFAVAGAAYDKSVNGVKLRSAA